MHQDEVIGVVCGGVRWCGGGRVEEGRYQEALGEESGASRGPAI